MSPSLFSETKAAAQKKTPARNAAAKDTYEPDSAYLVYGVRDAAAGDLFAVGNVTYVDYLTADKDGKLNLPKLASGELLLRCRRHDGEWTDAEPDAATGAPRHTFTCAVCGLTATTENDSHIHSFTSYTSDHNATCTQDGTMTALCDVCGMADTVPEVNSATGHAWDEGKTNVVNCTQPGERIFTCTICGETMSEPTDPIGAHTFGEWTETKPATVTEEGEETRECTVCGETETRPVAKLEPTYTIGDVDGDGAVKAEDARLALRASVKLEPDIVAGTAAYQAADYNQDGEVKSEDARAILRVSVKLDPFG